MEAGVLNGHGASPTFKRLFFKIYVLISVTKIPVLLTSITMHKYCRLQKPYELYWYTVYMYPVPLNRTGLYGCLGFLHSLPCLLVYTSKLINST